MAVATFGVALGLATGCTYGTLEGPVTVSTKPLPNVAAPPDAKPVSATTCDRVVLLIIPVGIATAEAAYADALAQAPGADTLLNYEARASVTLALPFYYQVCHEVRGLAVSSRRLVGAAD